MGNETENSGQNINPAWKPLLDSLPNSLHGLIIPHLKEWDKGVQKKFEDIRSEFDELKAYEGFVKNNIDPEYAARAVELADQLQANPGKIMDQVNQTWNLGYVSKEDAAKLGQSAGNSTDESDLFGNDDEDILKNPKVKAMYESLNKLQQEFETTKEREARERQEQSEYEQFDREMTALEEKCKTDNVPFHRDFVTGLVSAGYSAEDALKEYHQILAGNAQTPDTSQTTDEVDQPPVVMGSEGSTGGGTPDGTVDFGELTKNDLNATVEQMLARAQESGQ